MIWKTIDKYPGYEISNEGVVRLKETKEVIESRLTGFGYLQVRIRSWTYDSIHNLVAEAFIGPRPKSGYEVDHIDNNKLNNKPGNLRWIHHGHNTIRARGTGGRRWFYPGELWLFKRMLAAEIPMRIIAKCFKCSTVLVSDVKRGYKDNHLIGGIVDGSDG